MQQIRLWHSGLVALALALVCIVTIDQPLARWLATRDTWPALWNDGIAYLEYPLGIEPYKWTGVWVLTLGSIATLAITPLRRYAFPVVLVTLVHFSGRILMLWLKFGFGRLRPTEWLKKGGDTFWRDNGWSFPSGHAILFASIVLPLVVVYPRSRPLLAIVVFAMLARVMVDAHFVSDVLAGYAATALLTWACVQWLRRWLSSPLLPASLR